MSRSGELSGVSIKAARTLEQQYLEGCDKSRDRISSRTSSNKNTDVFFFGFFFLKKGGLCFHFLTLNEDFKGFISNLSDFLLITG